MNKLTRKNTNVQERPRRAPKKRLSYNCEGWSERDVWLHITHLHVIAAPATRPAAVGTCCVHSAVRSNTRVST